MRTREMSRLMNSTAKLTLVQRAMLLAHLQICGERDRAAAVVHQRLPDRPACPKCCATRAVRNGQADGLQRYKCRGCSVTFNALTGTPLARLRHRHRQRWLAQCEALQDGLSVRKAAAQLGVHRTTAFRWRHRFLRCAAKIKDLAMRGVVEADETYVLESFKGQRKALAGAGRRGRRRGGKARKRGLSREQVPILVLRARTGQTADFVLPAAPDRAAVKAVMACAVADDAVLCTDGSGLLTSAARSLDIEHQPVNLSKGQRVRGAWHGRQRQRLPESSQAVAAPLQRRGQLLTSRTTWAGSERSTVEGLAFEIPHGCSLSPSTSEAIISQREQSLDPTQKTSQW